MKHAKYLLVLVVALAIAIPVGMTAVAAEDDPEESPEVSGSESPEASESESPGVSRSPGASATPDDEDDDAEESSTPKASSSPKVSSTARPSKTPEQEREQERENEEEGEGDLEREREQERDAEETPEVSVPPELEDDADDIISDDDNVTKIEIDEDEGRVEVKYRLRAKLFGFLDVPYELEAQVETKAGVAKVETRGPWWLLFAVDDEGAVRDALEADPTLADATNQGTILSTIIGILKLLAK